MGGFPYHKATTLKKKKTTTFRGIWKIVPTGSDVPSSPTPDFSMNYGSFKYVICAIEKNICVENKTKFLTIYKVVV